MVVGEKIAADKAEIDEIPINPGSMIGVRNRPCRLVPEAPRTAPERIAIKTLGIRIVQSTALSLFI